MQGGVFPKCEHGSIVIYMFELLKFIFFDKALNSACGLPPGEVLPDDITVPFFSTTQPTEGLVLVVP